MEPIRRRGAGFSIAHTEAPDAPEIIVPLDDLQALTGGDMSVNFAFNEIDHVLPFRDLTRGRPYRGSPLPRMHRLNDGKAADLERRLAWPSRWCSHAGPGGTR